MRALTDFWGGISRRLPFASKEQQSSILSEQDMAFWKTNGFLVLPGFFSDDGINRVNQYMDELWEQENRERSNIVIDIFVGTDREKRVNLKNSPQDARFFPFKLNDLYLESDIVRNVVLAPQLVAILRQLLGAAPLVCNTLNFIYGSQQQFHTDSLYMPAPVDLNLAATWIALEDCDDDAGPLQYYPGSHLIPPFRFSHGGINAKADEMEKYAEYMQRAVESRGLRAERFCARKGDMFIWHSQLFHGGSPIQNLQKSRKSLVTHYWRSIDCPKLSQEPVGQGFYWKRSRQPVPQ
ncbi:phytanoyl-CoA dioxygenase family protein [Oligoflexus tunisiensis]|uniref:phytanoyl-CoA dioxygenase family protein n=1 Tax=Oligoflexus tunisiensis TaxID=708132 RepID=UPI00114CB065|nr:phytanoyl-CoA dioxygenase family protein [Oligoflexus tunisiensis]